MYKKDFSVRLSILRNRMNVSARDMSLSLGQNPGYINNIENCVNYPSMKVFFLICDYFEITPQEFFDPNCNDPRGTNELFNAIKDLNSEQQSHIIALAKALKK